MISTTTGVNTYINKTSMQQFDFAATKIIGAKKGETDIWKSDSLLTLENSW